MRIQVSGRHSPLGLGISLGGRKGTVLKFWAVGRYILGSRSSASGLFSWTPRFRNWGSGFGDWSLRLGGSAFKYSKWTLRENGGA